MLLLYFVAWKRDETRYGTRNNKKQNNKEMKSVIKINSDREAVNEFFRSSSQAVTIQAKQKKSI